MPCSKPSKRALKWIGVALVVVVGLFIGFRYWRAKQTALPEGIASGNGRLEGKLVDVSAKEPLRVKEILVDEGNIVKPGHILVRLETDTLDAQLAEARAKIDAAQEKVAYAKASIAKQKSEIELAQNRGHAIPEARGARRGRAAQSRRPHDEARDDAGVAR